jgi:hypothetical protein
MFELKCSLLNKEYVLILVNALKALVSIVFVCSPQVILLSNVTPRYFTLFTKGMFCPFIVIIERPVFYLKLNSTL